MFNLDDKYKIGQKLLMKTLIPNELKPVDKKKIKENIKSCTFTYQIRGEEIPSIVNDEYNVEVIQFFDFEVTDVKKAVYLGNMYHDIIKPLCVLRFYDNAQEVYSFGLKRLNQNDNNQNIVTDNFITEPFLKRIISEDKKKFQEVLDFDNIIGTQNKQIFYQEMYIKAYILTNNKLYKNIEELLQRKDIWHNENKAVEVYSNLRKLELLKASLTKINNNREIIKVNKEIRGLIEGLSEV